MPLVKFKNFKALINGKPLFDQPIKNKPMKGVLKCEEMMTIHPETCKTICTTKIIIS